MSLQVCVYPTLAICLVEIWPLATDLVFQPLMNATQW